MDSRNAITSDKISKYIDYPNVKELFLILQPLKVPDLAPKGRHYSNRRSATYGNTPAG